MKKVLALVLAVAMLAALNVGALAEGPADVIVENAAPGETLYWSLSVNSSSQLHSIQCVSDNYTVQSIASKAGHLTIRPDGSRFIAKPSVLCNKAEDIGKKINDTLVVTLSNGKTYDFPVEITFTDSPVLQFPNNHTRFVVGKNETIEVVIGDLGGKTTSPYQANMYVSNDDPYTVPVVSDTDAAITVGDITVEGTTIKIPVTPVKVGTGYFTIVVSDSVKYHTTSGWSFTVTADTSTPDDPNQPTPPVTDPDDPDQPTPPVTDPDDPDRPNPPVVDSGASDDKAPQATDNAANDDKTGDALRSGNAAEVKLTNGSAGISVDTANLLGGGSGKLTLVNNGMTVTIPGGFGKVTEAGRIYYPFDYEQNPKHASDMLAAVKGENARSEAVKAGGVMTLPTTATVTLKTRLTGTVNVYYYNEDTGKFTLVASPAAKDGTVTFATRQMGYFLLTTGRI